MGLESIIGSADICDVDVTPVFSERLREMFAGRKSGSLKDPDLAKKLEAAIESEEVKGLYETDINGPWGRAANKIVKREGYTPRMPNHYTWLELPDNALAATITLDNERVILAYNSKHKKKLTSSMPWNRLERLYVNMHEHMHVCGVREESGTDRMVSDAARFYREKILPTMTGYLDKLKRGVLEKVTQVLEYTGMQRAVAQFGY